MRIVSWNIHRCFGADGVYHPERVLNTLAELRADVIALQEVDSSLRWRGEIDQLTYLARGLGFACAMGPTLTRDYGVYGNALLTRGEIISSMTEDLSFRKFEPRGALCARVRIDDDEIDIINTHLGLKAWERKFQLDIVLNRLVRERADGVLLVGDFNEWNSYTRNTRRLERSTSRASPRRATFPSRWPKLALDRAFLIGPRFDRWPRAEINPVDVPLARVASDHLPLLLELHTH